MIQKRKFKQITSIFLFIITLSFQTAFANTGDALSKLQNADIETIAAQPKYDSRDYGIVTPVRDQGYTSLCWAYSTANASETSILRRGIDKNASVGTLSLSPQQIGYARNNRGADPLGNTQGEHTSSADNWQNIGGGTKYAAALLSTWCGPVTSNTAYNANGWENAAYKLESAIAVDGKNLNSDSAARDKMKRAVVKYGAVTFSYNNARELYYYNPNGESGSSPHACTIIGWDDTIPAENFKPGNTTIDGGWLVKNSYSSLPYFYLSYEVTCEQIYAFDYAPNDKYDFNYFYDASAADSGYGSLLRPVRAANVFEAKGGSDGKNETIRAVSVGTVGENAECTVEIYTDVPSGGFNLQNANLAASKTVSLEYGGYNCIELDTPVEVRNGSRFAAVVTVSGAYITLSENEGNSYIYRGGWASSPTPRIKVFTKAEENPGYTLEFTDDTHLRVYAESGTKQLIIAKYENDKLSDLYTDSLNFDTNNEYTVPLPLKWKKSESTKYKAFLWDDFNGMQSECNPTEI